jgi:hypothetical protein
MEDKKLPFEEQGLPYEPKRNNRFTIEFPENINIPKYVLKSATKPHFNGSWWSPIEIELYDPIGPSTSQVIHELIQYQSNDDLCDDEPFFQIHLNSLDPAGEVIEKWEIDVAYIDEVNFGELNYESATPTIIKMKLAIAKCVLLY